MDWLARVFAVGRLKRPPADQNAGRFLPPASVQRTQLGLAAVDLPAGVVELRGGEVRAFLAVSGEPTHHRGQAEVRAFLTRVARAINAMPPDTAWLVRSRAGVLQTYLRRRRDQTTALATRAPGSALARLAADQLANVRRHGHRRGRPADRQLPRRPPSQGRRPRPAPRRPGRPEPPAHGGAAGRARQ